jgi:hypothetical protein
MKNTKLNRILPALAGALLAVNSLAGVATAQDYDKLRLWHTAIRETGGYWDYTQDEEGVFISVDWVCIPTYDTTRPGGDPFDGYAEWDTDGDGDVDEDDIPTDGWGPPIPTP